MNILPEGGRYDFIGFLIIIQLNQLQIIQHLLFAEIGSQKPVDLIRVKGHSGRLALSVINVNHTVYHFTGSQLLDQLAGTINGSLGIVRIQTLFKLTGSIGTKTDTLCGKTDIHAVKAGSLKQHCLYVICNHGILTAHDTCDSHSLLAVADHQDIFIHGTLLAVQSHKLLAFLCPAHQNLMTRDGIQVVSVHGLAILFHYIIGDIHDIIDGTDAIDCQSALHPLR